MQPKVELHINGNQENSWTHSSGSHLSSGHLHAAVDAVLQYSMEFLPETDGLVNH